MFLVLVVDGGSVARQQRGEKISVPSFPTGERAVSGMMIVCGSDKGYGGVVDGAFDWTGNGTTVVW